MCRFLAVKGRLRSVGSWRSGQRRVRQLAEHAFCAGLGLLRLLSLRRWSSLVSLSPL
jgi:hypothetical protein